MSTLINLNQINLAFGLHRLLDEVRLQVDSGERVCLIGRNGAGKSTLLKVIEGNLLPDSGEIWRKPNLRLARLEQELPQKSTQTVYEFVADGLADIGKLLAEYHLLIQDPQDLARLEWLQHEIEAKQGWLLEQRVNTVLSRLQLDADRKIAELSGGWQRRAALARALVIQPELLLLDEPTNHLDISAIQWLEDQLIDSKVGLLFITHDRSLLQRLATRIIELDRGQLTSWPGDYDNFLRRKEELLQAEARFNSEFDKKLAQEEQWIRQGIKARRTRNEGRVRELESLRVQRSQRQEVQGNASFDLNEAQRSGQLVAEAKHITHAYNNQTVIDDFSIKIMRGDRIGLIGPNGVGKSTLLNILLREIPPQQGTVRLGTKLQVAYFDQLRQTLNPEKTVLDNLGAGQEFIEVNGKKRHVISYLADFLFTPQRVLTPVKALSGGECNRLVLAGLFSQPSNLLVMDEPTNDLDIETLELLEELLSQYQGTLLLVSHDRAFVDNVVTSTLVFEGDGKISEYVGGYQDYLRQAQAAAKSSTVKNTTEKSITTNATKEKITTTKKLSYNEQRELTELPKKIETLEAEQHQLQEKIADAAFYQQDAKIVATTMSRLTELHQSLEIAYKRWEELEK